MLMKHEFDLKNKKPLLSGSENRMVNKFVSLSISEQ